MDAQHAPSYPRRLVPLPVGAVAGPGSKLVLAGDVYLTGYSFRETTGAAVAQLDLIDGQDASGILIASIGLIAGGFASANFGGHFLTVRTGLFVNVLAGSIVGTLYAMDRVGEPRERHASR